MLKEVFEIFKLTLKTSPEAKKQWRAGMYKNRWRNFFGTTIFVLAALGFVFFGFWQKQYFFTLTHWYLWLVVISVILFVGVVTWFYYLWLIIKRK